MPCGCFVVTCSGRSGEDEAGRLRDEIVINSFS